MKRNLDLIRDILLVTEAKDVNTRDFTGHTTKEVAGHMALLKDAGLVEANVRTDENNQISDAHVFRLTSYGHDFLDASRPESIWTIAKDRIAATVGTVAIDVLVDLLKSLARQSLGV